MILLDYHNRIIEDTILEKYAAGAPFEAVEMVIADFDGVTFHISTVGETKNLLQVSISIKIFEELRKYGVEEYLKTVYGAALVAPENGYNATVQVDLAAPPADRAALARNVARLKRNCFAAPFLRVFQDLDAKKASGLVEIRYRDDEAFYLKPEGDRCTVIFNIQFKDKDDVVFAKVFLQEFQDARRTMSNAPSVTYSQKEPPLELQGAKNLRVGEAQGFVSFVLFQPHIAAGRRDKTIDNIQTFRNYLHYHIKCSKAHIHTRMRNRVCLFLQVLNRAKSEQAGDKKTMQGKAFKRSDDPQGADSLDESMNI
jgi:actin related protein 2/3 complex subunit 2